MHCPKCESKEYTKDGFALKKQRYKCKKCGCNFTQSHSLFASEETKALALKMYLEGMGFRAIGRVVGFSNVSVLRWIRNFGEAVETRVQMEHDASKKKSAINVVEMDDMEHFTKKREKRGYG